MCRIAFSPWCCKYFIKFRFNLKHCHELLMRYLTAHIVKLFENFIWRMKIGNKHDIINYQNSFLLQKCSTNCHKIFFVFPSLGIFFISCLFLIQRKSSWNIQLQGQNFKENLIFIFQYCVNGRREKRIREEKHFYDWCWKWSNNISRKLGLNLIKYNPIKLEKLR